MGIIDLSTLPRPLPAPIGCWEEGSFQQHTLLVRLPEIARRVLVENDLTTAAHARVRALIADMPDGKLRDLDDDDAPDAALWRNYLKDFIGKTWRELTFVQAEMVFYRRIIEAVGYYRSGDTFGKDPFIFQKNLGLETSVEAVKSLSRRVNFWRDHPGSQALYEALETMLWGNRADLSLWPAGETGTASPEKLHQADDFLMVNDIGKIAAGLGALNNARVDMLVDNSGYELICDLALADVLLGSGLAARVLLHVKAHPTFVSDATEVDVRHTLAVLAGAADEATQSLGNRLLADLATRKLMLRDDFFWNAPLPFWDMSPSLAAELSKSDWVLCKGDANYRRLTGDLHWAPETPFEKVTAYFPTRLAALRVSKSDVVVGLKPGQSQLLTQTDPTWRTNGRWGMVQAVNRRADP